jgi:transposase
MTTAQPDSTGGVTWVAIDIAKKSNTVLVEHGEGERQQFRMANSPGDHDRFVAFLRQQSSPCRIAMEPTGNYHRPLAYRLLSEGFEVFLISSVAAARFREITYNSWDKNDPKDTAVILGLLKEGRTLRYHDPMHAGIHDLQELSKTYMQITGARTRLYHSLITHALPLYWPEFQRYWIGSRTDWICDFLHEFPIPAAIRRLDLESFVREAWSLVGRKVNKRRWVEELYELADKSIGLPVELDSLAVQSFRLQLARMKSLNQVRDRLEILADQTMSTSPDYALLRSIPGIGPVLGLVILAEAGDLRRFGHHRQFLKFCGLDLAKIQSGLSRGRERLSKRGNARLRSAFWFAGTIAVRMRENSFRAKYERYMKPDPLNRDRRRCALTAVSAKIARVAYAVIKTEIPYRPYFEVGVPSGSIPRSRAVEATRTS